MIDKNWPLKEIYKSIISNYLFIRPQFTILDYENFIDNVILNNEDKFDIIHKMANKILKICNEINSNIKTEDKILYEDDENKIFITNDIYLLLFINNYIPIKSCYTFNKHIFDASGHIKSLFLMPFFNYKIIAKYDKKNNHYWGKINLISIDDEILYISRTYDNNNKAINIYKKNPNIKQFLLDAFSKKPFNDYVQIYDFFEFSEGEILILKNVVDYYYRLPARRFYFDPIVNIYINKNSKYTKKDFIYKTMKLFSFINILAKNLNTMNNIYKLFNAFYENKKIKDLAFYIYNTLLRECMICKRKQILENEFVCSLCANDLIITIEKEIINPLLNSNNNYENNNYENDNYEI